MVGLACYVTPVKPVQPLRARLWPQDVLLHEWSLDPGPIATCKALATAERACYMLGPVTRAQVLRARCWPQDVLLHELSLDPGPVATCKALATAKTSCYTGM